MNIHFFFLSAAFGRFASVLLLSSFSTALNLDSLDSEIFEKILFWVQATNKQDMISIEKGTIA